MDYKYSVTKCYVSGAVTNEFNIKFDTMDKAFKCFMEDVNYCRNKIISDSWTVSLWSEEYNTLILDLNDSDFE